MPFEHLDPFFTTTAGAAATLIGLLTVASTIWNRGNKRAASLQESILASSAYFAFANIFFVSLIALEPFINIGYGAIVLAIIGLVHTSLTAKHRLHTLERLSRARAGISRTVLAGSVATYVAQLIAGILVVLNTNRQSVLIILIYVIISLFAVGLSRAWELITTQQPEE